MRLIKLGVIGGVAIGIAQAVKRRRKNSTSDQRSWPTLAETATQDSGTTASTSVGGSAADPSEDAPETSDTSHALDVETSDNDESDNGESDNNELDTDQAKEDSEVGSDGKASSDTETKSEKEAVGS